jgi:predicted nucleic acid-binding protein
LYLVDTNVISATAPARAAPAGLIGWMDAHSDKLFISVVTFAEIEDGIAKVRREGATRKAAALAAWVEALLHLYASKILPVDIAVARIAGGMADLARGAGQAPGFADIMLAATARRHGLTVLTRNVRHFVPLGVPVFDPFAGLPTGDWDLDTD